MQTPSILPADTDVFEQLSLIDSGHPVVDALRNTDVDDLSPKQALDLLFKLKEKL